MKKSLVVLAVLALSFVFTQSVFAQVQGVTMTVNQIALLSVPTGPVPLTITAGTAGSDDLTPVTGTSSYIWTHNYATGRKITAKLTTALPTGYTLTLTTTPTGGKGTGVTAQTLADAAAHDVVTAMTRGFENAGALEYTFGAKASAVDLSVAEGTNTVTYTIVAP